MMLERILRMLGAGRRQSTGPGERPARKAGIRVDPYAGSRPGGLHGRVRRTPWSPPRTG